MNGPTSMAGSGGSEGPPDAPASPTRVTYLGHASFLIESESGSLLTDPVFSDRIGGFFTKRTRPSVFDPGALRGGTGVLISHGHHDHLDYPSLRRLPPPVPMVVPWGLATSLRWHGFPHLQVLEPGCSTPMAGWRIEAVPTRHFGGRLPLVGTSGHLGYVLSGPNCIYFAGDTGFDAALFEAIGRRFPLDLALLPIAGAVFPWYRRNHMDAGEALEAFERLGAREMVPMHFGTFPASFEPPGAPVRRLREEAARRGISGRVRILAEGEHLECAGTGGPRSGGRPPARPSARPPRGDGERGRDVP